MTLGDRGGEGGSSQKVTSSMNNVAIQGVHYKLQEMLYKYTNIKLLFIFFILYGLKSLKIVINITVEVYNLYFKF